MNTRRAGYSLFEVLIAFAILTLVLTALIPGQARLLARVQKQDDSFLAQDYAFSRMAQIGVVTPLAEGTTNETYRDWRIVETMAETRLDEPDIPLYKISIDVLSQSGNTLAHVETLRGIR
ncbi:prepilin-type N-terminal cleavage/methylation domain-containing protein [Profundibacter sp.]